MATRVEINVENTVIVDVDGVSEQIRVIRIYWLQYQNRNLDEWKPFIVERTILTGDFNAAAEQWNSSTTDAGGTRLKKWIDRISDKWAISLS